MASSHKALPRVAVPFLAALAFTLPASEKSQFPFALLDALFCFEDEAAALVEVDAPCACRSVRVVECYGPLEDVLVFCVIGFGGVGSLDAEHVA